MPDATTPDEIAARLAAVKADLGYYRSTLAAMQVGAQPPTVYADKYAADVGFLLGLLEPAADPAPEPPRSELETALDHDAVGRPERKKRG